MIYVDVSSAVHSKAGLQRYADSLVRALVPLLGARLGLFQNSLGRLGPLDVAAAGGPQPPTVGVPFGYKPWRGLVALRQALRLSMDGTFAQAELFHATEHLLPPLAGVPTVLTVHDLVFEHYPQYHRVRNRLYLRAMLPLFARRASAIITVSQFTKDDLVHRYAIPEAKVTVIPEAAALRFAPQPEERVAAARLRYGLPHRYLLTVGTIEPRKNLTRLLEACGPLFDDTHIDALVIVGSKGWLYEGFFRALEAFPWRHRVLLPGYVPTRTSQRSMPARRWR